MIDDNPGATELRSQSAFGHLGLGLALSHARRLTEAEAEYRNALAIYQKLAGDDPTMPRHRDGVADTANNLAVALRRVGRAAETRDLCDRAVALREALIREDPGTASYRSGLAENCLNRALARRATGDSVGAAADLRRATDLYGALPSLAAEQRFRYASARAALAALAGTAGSGVSDAEAASEADMAMALLRNAVEMGYISADAYRTDDALDPLRNRPDFKRMMMDLSFPAEPFTP